MGEHLLARVIIKDPGIGRTAVIGVIGIAGDIGVIGIPGVLGIIGFPKPFLLAFQWRVSSHCLTSAMTEGMETETFTFIFSSTLLRAWTKNPFQHTLSQSKWFGKRESARISKNSIWVSFWEHLRQKL